MTKVLFIFLLIFFLTLPLFAQVDTAWVRRYNKAGDSSDVALAIALDDSDNVYVAGNNGIIKYDSEGTPLWIVPWKGRDIATDTGNYVYVTGSDCGYTTVKCYPNGDTAWVRKYSGEGS